MDDKEFGKVLFGGPEVRAEDPLKYDLVHSDFATRKNIINSLEIDFQKSRYEHVTLEHLELLKKYLEEDSNSRNYRMKKEADECLKELEWLRKIYLDLKMFGDLNKKIEQIKPYIPQELKDIPREIEDLFCKYSYELEVIYHGKFNN